MEFEEEEEEVLQGIIALMGPPYSRKTQLAERIGRWAKCPVLCIQDFLYPTTTTTTTEDIKKNATYDKEVMQHAFTNLCKVAHRHLSNKGFHRINPTVVIKSRLDSTFELQHLLELITRTKTWPHPKYPILIIECRFANEYLWKQHFESEDGVREEDDCSWYRPRSWKEMEKARDDYYHPQSQAHWDLHLQQLLLKADSPTIIRRLVVDPIDILSFSDHYVPNEFGDAIKYLFIAPQGEFINISQNHPYNHTVEFLQLRPYLFEKRLSYMLATKGRRNGLCRPRGECIFKYWEELIHHHHRHVCGVCDKRVDSGTPAYTCHLCIHTLHKSCAEKVDFKALRFTLELFLQRSYEIESEHESYIPTIINNDDSHPAHFLSSLLIPHDYRCNACGEDEYDYSYCCKKCGLYYHRKCALLPLELHKHEHGGHDHVMKLMYSHYDDDVEPEESYWCEVCYKDMDPQVWFYSCKDCPYFAAHLECARGYKYLGNVKNAKFVRQIQSQLEDAMAEVNADSEVRDNE